MNRSIVSCLVIAVLTGSAAAQPTNAALEKQARAILTAHCFKCHSHEVGKAKGDLMLDTRAFMLKGGDNGPSIVPGDPAKSLLIKSVLHTDPELKMPRSAP